MGWGAENCTRADQLGTGCNFTGWEPTFTPSLLGEMASPIRGERTSVAPYSVGTNTWGWYRSEFGCSSFPSFESLSGMLLPEHWGVHTPPMRQRNHAADHIIFSCAPPLPRKTPNQTKSSSQCQLGVVVCELVHKLILSSGWRRLRRCGSQGA